MHYYVEIILFKKNNSTFYYMESKPYLKKPYWDGKIIDIHCHFFPHPLFKAIWNYFEKFDWNIVYKGTPEQLSNELEKLGVKCHSLLNYAHKPGIAKDMNQWTEEFAKKNQSTLPFFTIHPEDQDNKLMAREFLEKGFTGLKLQPLVQNFHVADERVTPVYEEIIKHGAWTLLHTGTAPYSNGLVGVQYFRKLMKRFPDLKVIVAHMGGYEFHEFFELLEKYPNMRLDTTMIFTDTDVFDTSFPKEMIDLVEKYSDKVLFGSDFPNIPYEYEESINGLLRLQFEQKVYEKIFYKNAERDFNID